jgi:hypothetical protein
MADGDLSTRDDPARHIFIIFFPVYTHSILLFLLYRFFWLAWLATLTQLGLAGLDGII